jgi:hypothetical protein
MTNQETNNQVTNPKTPQFQEVERVKKVVRTDSYFDGKVLDLIGWRILAFLITSITFGLAAPWAKCMLYSYQIRHTVYNGKRLKFEGTGGSLFVNTFKWIFFSIITLGIYTLVIPVKKTKWVISHIHFEDEDFINGESYFDGNTLQLIGVNLLSGFLTLISFGLLYPFTVCYKLKWINKHTVINRKKLAFTGTALSLWGHYLLWYLLLIVTFGLFGFWLPIQELKWQSKNTHIRTVGEVDKNDKTLWIAVPVLIIAIILGSFAVSRTMELIEDADIDLDDISISEIFSARKKKNTVYYRNVPTDDIYELPVHEENKVDVITTNDNKVDEDGYTTYVDPNVDYSSYRQPYVPSLGGVEDVLANSDIVGAPAIQEIPGEYIIDIRDGSYNTVQSDVKVTFASNGTYLRYNGDKTTINYDPSSGYAYSAHSGESTTYDAYFTVLSDGKIKVEMNISTGDNFTNIIGYKE